MLLEWSNLKLTYSPSLSTLCLYKLEILHFFYVGQNCEQQELSEDNDARRAATIIK